jgi:methylated-DNA-protein-cysteine methyltransferase-like protein
MHTTRHLAGAWAPRARLWYDTAVGARESQRRTGTSTTRRQAPARPQSRREPAPADDLTETASLWEVFYRVVRRIPAGRVATYGIVAGLAGHPRSARHVGFALAALKETRAHHDVPWHRVLGGRPRRRAGVSIRDPIGGALQRSLLEREGVEFDRSGSVALDAFGWFGDEPKAPPPKKRGGLAQRSRSCARPA